MVTVQVLRPPTVDEREQIRRLDTVAREHDGFVSLASAVWRDLDAPTDVTTGLLAFEGGEVAGYAHLAASDTFASPHLVAGIVIHPAHRAAGTVAAALLAELRDAAAAAGGSRVVLWVTGAGQDLDAAVRSVGFRLVGEQLQMRVPLPLAESPRWPPGIEVRSFVPGQDDDAWLHVNNRAFRNHPDQGGWVASTLQRRLGEPWFDAAGFLLAFDAAGLAGFCWTKVHEPAGEDPLLGEIFVIGVDPDRQGIGLGRALTVGGLEYLATKRRCATGMLYVDGANAPALGLYRALGFTPYRTDRSYEIDVVPA